MPCPYCDSNHFTSDYIRVQPIQADSAGNIIQDEIGYNKCASCYKWSKYTATNNDDRNEAIDNAEQRPNI